MIRDITDKGIADQRHNPVLGVTDKELIRNITDMVIKSESVLLFPASWHVIKFYSQFVRCNPRQKITDILTQLNMGTFRLLSPWLRNFYFPNRNNSLPRFPNLRYSCFLFPKRKYSFLRLSTSILFDSSATLMPEIISSFFPLRSWFF